VVASETCAFDLIDAEYIREIEPGEMVVIEDGRLTSDRPFREAKPRFCIFGDSHYACLRQAQRQGLVDMSGLEVEHWGHVGGRFLFLELRDGAIHPKDDFTAARFARFNEKARTFLPADAFDAILVMGARTYLLTPFQMSLVASSPNDRIIN